MKEATSELNVTVIVIIAIGTLSAFFFGVVWPRLHTNLESKTKCSDAICPNPKDSCFERSKNGSCKIIECNYKGRTIKCPYKG